MGVLLDEQLPCEDEEVTTLKSSCGIPQRSERPFHASRLVTISRGAEPGMKLSFDKFCVYGLIDNGDHLGTHHYNVCNTVGEVR
jgi:hypothetical protein